MTSALLLGALLALFIGLSLGLLGGGGSILTLPILVYVLGSLAATITFMATGFATVFVTRHLLGGG